MFKRESFGTTEAKEVLSEIKGTFVYPESGKIDDVNAILEKVIFALNRYGAIPKHILTRALYDNGDGQTLRNARFVVKPSVHTELDVAELKYTFNISAGEKFFDDFIDEMANWFDEYQYNKQLQENVDELNAVVTSLIEENELPFDVKFSVGKTLLDASDNHVVIGLDHEVVMNLSELALFDEQLESRVEGYKSRLLETLKEASKPYELVKVKSSVTKDLGIYSRRSLNKLMRQFVSREISYVRTGVGYKETENEFALVQKVAVTEEELANIDTTDALVIDNEKASAKEKEAGKTKIVVTYKVAPFKKETGEPSELSLKEVI